MLDKILAISGKPGLYKMISGGRGMIVVESLTDKKRMPAHTNERVISLNDIAMYTEAEDVPLRQILKNIQTKEGGKSVAIDARKADSKTLRSYMKQVLPNFDEDRVHDSDIKKLILWYNLLVEAGETDFEEPKEEEKAD